MDSASFSSLSPSVFFIICLPFSNFLRLTLTQSSSVIFLAVLSLSAVLSRAPPPLFSLVPLNLRCPVSLSLSSFCLFYFMPFEPLFRSLLSFSHALPFLSLSETITILHEPLAFTQSTTHGMLITQYSPLLPRPFENRVCFAVAA